MDVASAIAQAGQSGGTQMRVGQVVAFTTGTITVSVGGGTLPAMPYTRSYRPLIGDTVIVFGTGPTWVCVGAITNSPPNNLLTNPQFDNGTTDWTLNNVNTSGGTPSMGSATVESIFPGEQQVGPNMLSLTVSTSPGDSQCYAYSSPITVVPGEQYAAAATVRGLAGGSAYNENTGVYLEVGWYTDAITTTPSSRVTSALSTMPQGYGWFQMVCGNAGITVPGGAAVMRVHLGLIVEDFSGGHTVSAYYDLAIARKIG